MAGISNTIIARLEKGGEKFEILVDPELAYAYKSGLKKEITNVLMAEEIFKDANKGERQSPSAIKKAFGTNDAIEAAKQIFKDGELQLTTLQRKKALEEKKAKIITLIAQICIDPRTKAPHPPARIEAAMAQARVSIDAFKSVEEQANKIIEELREIIPISTEKIKIAIKISALQASRAYGFLKDNNMIRQEYAKDGALVALCEIPAGLQGEFYEKLNKITGGSAETKKIE